MKVPRAVNAMVVCLCLVVCASFLALRGGSDSVVSIGGITREYKNIKLMTIEVAYIWPWEYQTTYERFGTMYFNGREYNARGYEVSSSLLGEELGVCNGVGYDDYNNTEHTMSFEVYQINGIAETSMVAVDLDGEFYVYYYGEYAPPSNFGAVLDDFSLSQNLQLDRFSIYEEKKEQGYFSLTDDEGIWDILNGCRDANFIEADEHWTPGDRKYISFTATSDALGVYKRVFYVTEDGYIWTNIFDYAYLFDIGEDAAGSIIACAEENGMEAQREPFAQSLTGTVVGIEDGYIMVDDSILCVNEKDGMIFKVPADDLRISRYIELDRIAEGDLVSISFTGNIDVASGNIVGGVYSIDEVILSDGELMIPE